jgi:hypothetical protein
VEDCVKWNVIGWVAVAVFSATTVSGQVYTEADPVTPIIDHALKISVIVWAASVTADQVTTYRFSTRYRDMIHEENPLIRGLDHRPASLVAAGAAMDAASGWLSYHFLRRHPRLGQMAFYGAAIYRTYLAVHNVQMMRQADDLRITHATR